MTDSMDLALKIMALVDENPSELFSLERKQIELKLEELISQHTQQIDNELQDSFDHGFDEGKYEAEEDYKQEIQELEDQVQELETQVQDLEDKIETAFVQGLEAATKDNIGADSFELK